MLKGRELIAFRKRLLVWFRQFQRDLPWRRTRDPYRIWLSEIMLQQTRVAVVIPYYERFLKRFPDIHALAAAPVEEVLRLWSGLGYYSRARNLQKAAQQIVAGHGGGFPRQMREILALPGIGDYTGAAILSIAFDQKHAVVDGNVARVLARLGAVRGNIRESRRWQTLRKTADAYLDHGRPGDWNQAVMELGATLCTPKSPQCLFCPVAQFCKGSKLGIAESLPAARKKRSTVQIRLAVAVFTDEKGQTLLLPPPDQRNGKPAEDSIRGLASNLWHFPTIPVDGDSVAKLRSFLSRRFAVARNGNLHFHAVPLVRHTVTYRAISIEPFRIDVKKLPRMEEAQRVPLSEITVLPVSNLTRKVARAALTVVPATGG